ncbi:type VI lipase adapter Tla3 domain-containing protein, partial [Achromobacter spanius]|uniref:type VI lipase adapter Tla3 domain-containing protein n=1 Tax=Achromobacter spanius TaxID=217203 RepID=UPI0032098CAB
MSPISFVAASLLLRWWAVAPVAPPPPLPETAHLAAMACPLPSTEAIRNAVLPNTPPTSKGALMLQPRLETLDIVRVGLSLDVYRQGQAWAQLQKQNIAQPNALLVGSALPMDRRDYPVSGSRKDLAWGQRKSNALEMALTSFPERWPVPTVLVVRDYDPRMARPRVPPKRMDVALTEMVSLELGDAGLHWHDVRQLDNGVIC